MNYECTLYSITYDYIERERGRERMRGERMEGTDTHRKMGKQRDKREKETNRDRERDK